MRYVIDIPDGITKVLEQRASAAGSEVVDIIREAVVCYARNGVELASIGREPDPPSQSLESAPSCDLPRNASRVVPIQQASRRLPDPIADVT